MDLISEKETYDEGDKIAGFVSFFALYVIKMDCKILYYSKYQ